MRKFSKIALVTAGGVAGLSSVPALATTAGASTTPSGSSGSTSSSATTRPDGLSAMTPAEQAAETFGTSSSGPYVEVPLVSTLAGSGSLGVVPDAVLDPAQCYLRIDYAHITYVNNNRVTKDNAYITGCQYKVNNLHIDANLYKTGLFYDYWQAEGVSDLGSGTYLDDEGAWIGCLNYTQSTFYGIASGSVVDNGVTYRGTVQSPNQSLSCGT